MGCRVRPDMTEEKVEQIRNSQHWYKQIFPFRRYPMKIDPPIKAKWFYMFASEKIKFKASGLKSGNLSAVIFKLQNSVRILQNE